MPTPLITIDQAQAAVLAAVAPLEVEVITPGDGVGRVLAQDIAAVRNSPPFACSAMDGYAIVAGPAGRRLQIIDEARAGTPATRPIAAGEAIRVSTGAAIPDGTTAVIPQEDTRREERTLLVDAETMPGSHVRAAGEDMRAGTIVVAAGTLLGPIELGATVAAGAGTLAVSRRPRVGVVVTGDELRAPGEDLGPGEIHNSNGPMLTGLARRCGAQVDAFVHLRDDRQATIDGIAAQLADHDVLILSGGVSVGPHDHVKPSLAALSVHEEFWSVNLQPGKPTWFGIAPNGTLVFGLPGNPVSSVVTFSLFVAPALAALQCGPAPRPPHPVARLGINVDRNPRRDMMLRVSLRLQPGDEGPPLVALPTGAQASHILTSLLDADALAVIPSGDGVASAGSEVQLRALVR